MMFVASLLSGKWGIVALFSFLLGILIALDAVLVGYLVKGKESKLLSIFGLLCSVSFFLYWYFAGGDGNDVVFMFIVVAHFIFFYVLGVLLFKRLNEFLSLKIILVVGVLFPLIFVLGDQFVRGRFISVQLIDSVTKVPVANAEVRIDLGGMGTCEAGPCFIYSSTDDRGYFDLSYPNYKIYKDQEGQRHGPLIIAPSIEVAKDGESYFGTFVITDDHKVLVGPFEN